jgi:hypothetical protein
MDTVQNQYTLKDVKSFLGVYPTDLLPRSIVQFGSVIVNTDPRTEKGSHWLAIHFTPRSSSAYYFDSYGNPVYIPTIQNSIRRNSTVCQYNTLRLQGPSSTICSQYCCLFALYTTQQFVGLFNADIADQQIEQLFASEFGPLPCVHRGG